MSVILCQYKFSLNKKICVPTLMGYFFIKKFKKSLPSTLETTESGPMFAPLLFPFMFPIVAQFYTRPLLHPMPIYVFITLMELPTLQFQPDLLKCFNCVSHPKMNFFITCFLVLFFYSSPPCRLPEYLIFHYRIQLPGEFATPIPLFPLRPHFRLIFSPPLQLTLDKSDIFWCIS